MERMILILVFCCLLLDSCWSSFWQSSELATSKELHEFSHNFESPRDILAPNRHSSEKNIFTSPDSELLIEQELLCNKADLLVGKKNANELPTCSSRSFKHNRPIKDGENNYRNNLFSLNSDNTQVLNEGNQLLSSGSNILQTNPEIFQSYQHPLEQGFTNHHKEDSNGWLQNQLQRQSVSFLSSEVLLGEPSKKSFQSAFSEKNEEAASNDFNKQLSHLEYLDRLNPEQQRDNKDCSLNDSINKYFNFSPMETYPINTYYMPNSQLENNRNYIPEREEPSLKFDEIGDDNLWINELLGSETMTEFYQDVSQLKPINSPKEKFDSVSIFYKPRNEKLPSSINVQQNKEKTPYGLAEMKGNSLEVLNSNRSLKHPTASLNKTKKRIRDGSEKNVKKKEVKESVDIISKENVELLIKTLKTLIQQEDLVLSCEFFDGKINKIKKINNDLYKFFDPYYQIIQRHIKRKNLEAFCVSIDNTAEFFSVQNFKGIKFEPVKESTDRIFEQIVQIEISYISLNSLISKIYDSSKISIQLQGKRKTPNNLKNESDLFLLQTVDKISKYYYNHYYNSRYLKITVLGIIKCWIRHRFPKLFQSIISHPMKRLFWNFIRDVVFFIMKSS
ncbi:hypothetical protein PPACK8108_LOCUS26376 [Phakopsora pachyrhizi]|uniref:Uncharacterized protein n=1 Tax=Phakopsora pachyrhizi TaxID=170000 RepID=A0AAV0BTZ3_PHAPC|nr:hypothetical protein PPACK8108_LOCUS26376 [Phakopsora pachyrhizi]